MLTHLETIKDNITVVMRGGQTYLYFNENLSFDDQVDMLIFLRERAKIFSTNGSNHLARYMIVEDSQSLLAIQDDEVRRWNRYVASQAPLSTRIGGYILRGLQAANFDHGHAFHGFNQCAQDLRTRINANKGVQFFRACVAFVKDHHPKNM